MNHDTSYHGSPYDRGIADSYYRRPRRPHWIDHSLPGSPRITDLTLEDRKAYLEGYAYNEENGDKKAYG